MQTSTVWSIIFKPNGVINTLLGRFDIKGPNWLGSGSYNLTPTLSSDIASVNVFQVPRSFHWPAYRIT